MLNIIVAIDKRGGIGKDNKIPWYLPSDLKYFKQTTLGKPIVMGRKTYESIGRALQGRHNIVLTKDQSYKLDDAWVYNSIYSIVNNNDYNNLFIIGGSKIYEQFLSHADKLYVTHINHEFEVDTYFPTIVLNEWKEVSRESGIKDEKNIYDHDFVVYEKRQG